MARMDGSVSISADPGTLPVFGICSPDEKQTGTRAFMHITEGDLSVYLHADRVFFANLATAIQQYLQDTEISQQEREIDNAGK